MATDSTISLTASQNKALSAMKYFVERYYKCFVLSGYAGTGKTTLMRFFIKYLQEKGIAYRLLSSTGRAAKILSNATGEEASTIHHCIYSFEGLNKDLSDVDEEKATPDSVGQLMLSFSASTYKPEEGKNGMMVYIIDEASMISDTPSALTTQATFGSGRALKDLLEYDERSEAKFVFVGDPCQLPPINGTTSPALDPQYIEEAFGYHTEWATLTEIMRQSGGNSIIYAAEMLRKSRDKAPTTKDGYRGMKVWGRLNLTPYPNVKIISSEGEMCARYVSFIQEYGYNEATFVCQSNGDATRLSLSIRKTLGFTAPVQIGDLLIVTQNQLTTGLMNGDMVKVVCVSNKQEQVNYEDRNGYRTDLLFQEVTVEELASGKIINTLLLTTLLSDSKPNLDARQQTGLFLDFVFRMKRKGITQKKKEEFNTALFNDPYLNALRCSYGYAITCHKAQGGEWNHVFVLPMRNIMLNPCKSNYQWLYTAITRAKVNVYFPHDFYIY